MDFVNLCIHTCIMPFSDNIKTLSAFEGKDLLDISEFAGGNIARIIVGLIVVIDSVLIISVKLREYTNI